MREAHKQARKRLQMATKKEYEYLIKEAHLTERQKSILHYYMNLGYTRIRIGEELFLSDKAVGLELEKIYKKVAQVGA